MNFKDALFSLMCQRQVCGMTGCSKASVSQYLSGKNVPSEQKQRDIAESLGVDPEYFKECAEPDKTKIIQKGTMKKMLPEVCAKILGVGKETVRLGLQQGVFPWGYAVQTSPGRWTYIINEQRFIDIEGIAP